MGSLTLDMATFPWLSLGRNVGRIKSDGKRMNVVLNFLITLRNKVVKKCFLRASSIEGRPLSFHF